MLLRTRRNEQLYSLSFSHNWHIIPAHTALQAPKVISLSLRRPPQVLYVGDHIYGASTAIRGESLQSRPTLGPPSTRPNSPALHPLALRSGDILRSKKQIGWRTMLIIPELAVELEARHKQLPRAPCHSVSTCCPLGLSI